MKATLLLTALLLSAGIAYADHTEDHERSKTNQQNLGRRPYSSPVEKVTTYEGDAADIEETKAEKNYKTLQLHMLGKRPYAEKSAD